MQHKNRSYIIGSILWPFAGLVSALRNWRQPWAMNVFWVACAYMGAIQIYHPKGTILGEGSDAGRYVLELQEMHRSVNSFEEVSRYFYDGDTNDVFCSTLQYVVSRFTENGHVFFFVLAVIYGFFYSRNIWYILNRISDQRIRWLWVMVAVFFLVCPIWNINGVRMWTALHVFVYGAMPYLLEGKKKPLVWSAASILIHHSFIFPIALLTLFFTIGRRIPSNSRIITVFFAFYIVTLTVKNLDLGALNTALQVYLPSFYSDRIDGYVNSDVLGRNLERLAQNSWHVAFFNEVHYWINQILVVFTYIIFKRNSKKLSWLLPLFSFSLLIYGFSNILACVPSGARYITISQMFMVATFLLTFRYWACDKVLARFIPIVMLLFAFSLIFEIRKGFDYYGLDLLCGNFISAALIEVRTPLINLVKFFS